MGLAYLVTLLLMATLVADGITRALPIDWLTFRPWEAALQQVPPGAAFEPHREIDCPRCYGDLANMANLPRYRVYRHERFSTDARGYRNRADLIGDAPVRILLVGDSFVAGAGLTDADTLGAKLTARLGVGAYNTAPMVFGPTGYKSLARAFGATSGVVVVQHLGWAVTPAIGTDGDAPGPLPAVGAADRFRGSFRRDVFPLRILANQAVKSLQTGRLLRNPFADFATIDELANGQPMLFRSADVAVWGGARPPFDVWAGPRWRDNVAFYQWVQEQIAPAGLRLAVLLVPHKYTAYQPFLRATPAARREVDPYLPGLAAALRQAGLVAIDLSQPFYAAAERGLATGELVYWPDDTHWSPHGVDVAVAAIAETFAAHGLP